MFEPNKVASADELLKRILADEEGDHEGLPAPPPLPRAKGTKRGIDGPDDPRRLSSSLDGAVDMVVEALGGDPPEPEISLGELQRPQKSLVRKSLGHILVDSDMITEQQLHDALAEQARTKDSLGVILVRKGYIREHQVKDALELQYGVKYANIKEMTVAPEILDMVPDNVIRHHKIVPLSFKDNTMTVGMVDPTNLLALDDLRFRFKGVNIEPVVIGEDDYMDFLGSLQYADTRQFAPGSTLDIVEDLVDVIEDRLETADYEDDVARDDAPLIRLANTIVINAIHEKASDIHIDPQEEEIKVRYRIDGMLYDKPALPRKLLASLVSRYKIMATLDIANKRLPQDGRMRIRLREKPIDFRVSTLPARHGEKLVLRILDKSSALIGLEKLFIWPEMREIVRTMAHHPFGCIYVTGPTGSGKTTSLYSILAERNTRDVNIVTAEDPIEYDMKGITQVQAKPDIGLTFASILKAFLRQDPDIVMIGETRDRELAKIVVESALTGHLVFTSLHTNDAPGAITRLLEMGVDKFLIAASTVGIIAQRLVRRLCLYCREKYRPEKAFLDFLGYPYKPGEVVEVYRPNTEGCEQCRGGYSGRIGVYEVMKMNDELRDLIGQGAPTALIRYAAKQGGMLTLKECSLRLVQEGHTSLEEVLRVTFSDEGQDKLCPECRNPVGDEFIKCPFCQHMLRSLCSGCQRPVQDNWQACPTCGVPVKQQDEVICLKCQVPLRPEWAGCPICLSPRLQTQDADWDSLRVEWQAEPEPGYGQSASASEGAAGEAQPSRTDRDSSDSGRAERSARAPAAGMAPLVVEALPPRAATGQADAVPATWAPAWGEELEVEPVVDADSDVPPPPVVQSVTMQETVITEEPVRAAPSRVAPKSDEDDADDAELLSKIRAMLDD